jgi:hypothetical protein
MLTVQFSVDFSRFSKMKMCKFFNMIILLICLKYVSGCIKNCICVSETELKCYNIQLNDYSNFESLSSKREILYFYKSTVSVTKLTKVMSNLKKVIVTKDCHVLDCTPLYTTVIEGCYNDDTEYFTNGELSSVTYTIAVNNNAIVVWQTLVGSLSWVLTLAICVTILR